jgi:hypothetical protein
MTGLVLGMLVSSAKSIYDAGKDEVANMSMHIVLIDRLLAGYGPETLEIRCQFRQLVEVGIERIWPRQGALLSNLRPTDQSQILVEQMQLLEPKNDRQASALAQANPLILNFTAEAMGYVSQNAANGYPTSTVSGGCLLVGDNLFQFWSFCCTKRHHARNIRRRRARSLLCDLHHSGNVYAIRGSTEDFACPHS